jgi:hypothetical protein
MKTWALSALGLAAGSAAAHGGHGLEGAHWHATDAWGWMVLGVGVALLVWMRRGK